MHIKRHAVSTKVPLTRKGTKYIALASSHKDNSVPVLIAVRDMLKLAKTAKEVKEMIKEKVLKINGRVVSDYHESIKLFNIFEAGKPYVLTILSTKRFAFEPSKSQERLCKIIGKTQVSKDTFQINCHDGSNLVTKDKIAMGDTLILDFSGKLKKHISLDKGKVVFIFSGKYTGKNAKVVSIEGQTATLKIEGTDSQTQLNKSQIIAL